MEDRKFKISHYLITIPQYHQPLNNSSCAQHSSSFKLKIQDLNLLIKTHDDQMSQIIIEFDPIEIASSLNFK